jgi:hypothetical protein
MKRRTAVSRRSVVTGMGVLAAAGPFAGRAGATVLSSVVTRAPAPGRPLPRAGAGVGPGPTPTSLRYHRLSALDFVAAGGPTRVAGSVPLDTGETVLSVHVFLAADTSTGSVVLQSDDGMGHLTTLSSAPADGSNMIHVAVDSSVQADPEQFAYLVAVDVGGSTSVTGAVITTLRPTASLVLMDPVRVLDTRTPGGGGRVVGGETRGFTVDTIVPRTALGPLLNVTLDQTAGSGYLVVFPGGDGHPVPPTSNLNWYAADQSVANLVVAAMAGEADLALHAGGPGSSHVIIDVLGYLA